MAGKSKYESYVKPFLDEISEWTIIMSEKEIAKKLGISVNTFSTYKQQHEELRHALVDGKKRLVMEIKKKMKQSALGYYYTETKTIVKKEHGQTVSETTETYNRYAKPELGAAHLLLKNNDDTWRNDDADTMEMKRRQIEIQQQKADNAI